MTPSYPDTFRAASAYLTAYLAAEDNPESERITEGALYELVARDQIEVVVVLTAMVGALVTQLADAAGRTPQDMWADHALAYTLTLAERGE
ncbi:hypothetical protein ACFV14_10785 [Streptomyces zaomyceticus]|uniref:hypothetical protein n=1 Tax=Streptomyces zaomyceticus TaxID=68286 RepID=UPI0036913567